VGQDRAQAWEILSEFTKFDSMWRSALQPTLANGVRVSRFAWGRAEEAMRDVLFVSVTSRFGVGQIKAGVPASGHRRRGSWHACAKIASAPSRVHALLRLTKTKNAL